MHLFRRFRVLAFLGTAFLWGSIAAPASAQVSSFTGVGDLAGGDFDSEVTALSADGVVVVGTSSGPSGEEAFYWTEANGIVGIGFLSLSSPFSSADAVSSDGTVIVGTSNDSGGVARAYRWQSGTMTALDRQSCSNCDPVTRALGVSGNGLVVVGSSVARGSGDLSVNPVRWPSGGTSLNDLGNFSASNAIGEAYGASFTGSVIVGQHTSGNGRDAFYWSGSGLTALPSIVGGSTIAARANAVSGDGSTIVGVSNQAVVTLPGGTVVSTSPQAVRWDGTNFSTLTELGALPGAVVVDSEALGISEDGEIIVGRAKNGDLQDRAFLWTATGGMRDLRTALIEEYGVTSLQGWVLTEASAVQSNGDLTWVAGSGVNPAGDPEGWYAVLVTPECMDGVENDSDGFVDFPNDPGCLTPFDQSESFDCLDGLDNDSDGQTDFSSDAGCYAPSDPTEVPDCQDGFDNDGDGFFDFPEDPGCLAATSPREDPACSNGLDDDGDQAIDYPGDAGCRAAHDLSEVPDCQDGLDNDGDGAFDFPDDPECSSASDPVEASACADGIDNDGNGLTDFPNDPLACASANDPIEAPQCNDGVDNDGDGQVDFPADAGCTQLMSQSESSVSFSPGDLFAVDRNSGVVFKVDRNSGVQEKVAQYGFLTAPQGIAQWGAELVVADPAGLVAILPSGVQRRASPPLVPHEELRIVTDPVSLDAFVLEDTEISRTGWTSNGIGTKTPWLTIPTPEPLAVLADWDGDALALDASGDLFTTGGSLYGDGLFRIRADTAPPSAQILQFGFKGVVWSGLAMESGGLIVGVGIDFGDGSGSPGGGVGVYRVDPSTGDHVPINTSRPWGRLTAIAVADDGGLYVADSGSCVEGVCTGGEIVQLDSISGAATSLSTGGFISGEVDLVVLPEPGSAIGIFAGVLVLAGFCRRDRTGARDVLR